MYRKDPSTSGEAAKDALDLLSYTWVWRMCTKRVFLPDANDRTILLLTIHHPIISQRDTRTDTVASTLSHHSQRNEIPPYGNAHGTYLSWETLNLTLFFYY